MGGRNFIEVITEFRRRLLEGLLARSTLAAYSAMKDGADGLSVRESPLTRFQGQVVWVRFQRGVGTE